MKKGNLIYVVVDILLWIMNASVLLVNYKNIQFNLFSVLALLPMLLMLFQAILSFQYRHCENMLKKPPLRRALALYNVQTQKSIHTYSAEYMKEFSLMFAIYVGVMSFQLLVFVCVSPQFQFLMSFFLLMLPYVFYSLLWIHSLIKKCKELRQKNLELEKDRLKQVQREEQGEWK